MFIDKLQFISKQFIKIGFHQFVLGEIKQDITYTGKTVFKTRIICLCEQ